RFPVGWGPPLALRGGIGGPIHDDRNQVAALLDGDRRRDGEYAADAVLDPHDSALTLQVFDEIEIGIATAVLSRDPDAERVLSAGHWRLLGRERSRPLPRGRSEAPGSSTRDELQGHRTR